MSKSISKNLLEKGLATRNGTELKITKSGLAYLRREKCLRDHEQIFVAQHQDRHYIEMKPIRDHWVDNQDGEKQTRPQRHGGESDHTYLLKNCAESPLAQLSRRRKKDGTPHITHTQFLAGERLRQDFEKAQLQPSMGVNWQRLGAGGLDSRSVRSSNDLENMSDGTLAARQRYNEALNAVGEEFASPLQDFCCFLHGLEQIEKSRNWPARSAKLILSMGLKRLAKHYGLWEEATGSSNSAICHWGTTDYRPQL